MLQIVIGSYGALLIIIISFLIKLLHEMNTKQNQQEVKVSGHSFRLKELEGTKIPTIVIQFEKLENRTDDLEHRADAIESQIRYNKRYENRIH